MAKYIQNILMRYDIEDQEKYLSEITVLYIYAAENIVKIKNDNNIGKLTLILSNSEEISFDQLIDVAEYTYPIKYLNSITPSTSDLEMKKLFLREVTEALIASKKFTGIDVDDLKKVETEIEKRNFKFEYCLNKPRLSPDKRHVAAVSWKTDDYINIGMDIKNKKTGEKTWFPVIKIHLKLGLFESLIGTPEWIDNTSVKLYEAGKKKYWKLNIEDGSVSFHHIKAEAGDPHAQYVLAKMYIDGYLVEKDLDMATHWLKKSAANGFGRAINLLKRIESGERDLADPFKNTLE